MNGRRIEVKEESINRCTSQGLRLVRCGNGHFFDGNRYQLCPHCGAGVKEGRKSMNAADFTNYKQIKEFHIFDGDFPAINYEYKDGKLYT